MLQRLAPLADPMIAVLLVATLAGFVLPATGEMREPAQLVTNVAIFVLFLVNGMRVARSEIARGFVNWRFFLPLMLFVFGAMALMGLGLSLVAAAVLPPMVAIGFLYLGTLPSTIQSAISYTTLAEGNVALSVIGAALINIAGVFVTAPLFAALGGGELAEIGSETILRIGLILILPFAIGQAVQGWTRGWVLKHKARIVWLDRIVIGIAVYVAFSGAVEQGLMSMFGGIEWGALLGLVVAFLFAANVSAWLSSGVLGFAMADRKAFLFAASQKSVAIGAPLAAILFAPEIAGFVIAPLLLYHLLQLMIAAPLASSLSAQTD
ncbi:bile acid:sodium symporter [Altererythrobacter lutimaris]|uniref:Bile acid:sodium symporter n=1 Tax=Altererythrobacter lutimaris TaxID=2743979 RepID=A0A850H745_9SPHN|nr:bile acid:sodium symporter [Altererythrobacter lutimaris]NVE93663.1 bile acid:sodium symporter [Altererythrobacter lutimaris]